MNSEYKDFGYSHAGPVNGSVGWKLAQIFVDEVRRLDGVQSVCDLGCGNGDLASRLGATGLRVTGIDASESGVEIARRYHSSDKVTFVRAEIGADVTHVLPADKRFDAVVSSDVIEHLYRPAALVEAAAALLGHGGYLVVGTPYHGYLKNVAISVLGKWDSHHGVHWDGGHIKFFSARTLRDLVVRHGFREPIVRCYGRVPGLWKHMICIARKDAVVSGPGVLI